MENRHKTAFWISLWIMGAVLAGCVSRPVVVEEPSWHLTPSGAYDTANGKVFFGVGKAQGTRNATLLKAAAVNHARKELARVLDIYVGELYRTAGPIQALTVEEGEQLIGTLVRNAMKLSVISDQLTDSKNDRLYALCRLDLEHFKGALASQSAIDQQARKVMAANAENVHDMVANRTN